MSIAMGKYRFFRAVESISGFLSQNRASTDAINVLAKWRAMGQGRDVAFEEGEEELVAILTFDNSDAVAGSQLEALCEQHGVGRQFVS